MSVQNLEEIFTRYYIHSDMFNMFKSSAIHLCVINRERFNMTLNMSTDFFSRLKVLLFLVTARF